MVGRVLISWRRAWGRRRLLGHFGSWWLVGRWLAAAGVGPCLGRVATVTTITMGNGRGKVKLGKDEDICIVTTNAKAHGGKGGNGRIRGHVGW